MPRSRFDDQAVNDDINVMLQLFVEGRHLADFVKRAIDFDALKAALLQFGKIAAIFAFAAAYNRRKQIKPRAFGQGYHLIDHLTDRLAFNRQAGSR